MRTGQATLDSVQALRAFAALAVVLYHVDFLGKGAFGVDVFFVISGFIICYVTAVDRSHFLTKRLIRIVPLYWTATLGVFAVALLAPRLLGATGASFGQLAESLLFIPYEKEAGRIVPVLFLGWTLNYEMFFYAVFAVALRSANPPLVACLYLATLVAFGQALPEGPVPWRFYTSPLLYEFCYGIVVFLAWRRLRETGRPLPAWIALSCLAAGVAMLLAVDQPMGAPLRFAAWGLPAALVVASTVMLQSRIAFPLLVVAIGDASYSLYLLHPYLLKAMEKVGGPLSQATPRALLEAALYVAAAVACALFIYRYFEKPALRLLRRALLPSDRTNPRPAGPADRRAEITHPAR